MKSKLISGTIFMFIFAVPFRTLYLDDRPVEDATSMFLLLTCVVGFLVAFGIGTNKPFDRKRANVAAERAPVMKDKTVEKPLTQAA